MSKTVPLVALIGCMLLPSAALGKNPARGKNGGHRLDHRPLEDLRSRAHVTLDRWRPGLRRARRDPHPIGEWVEAVHRFLDSARADQLPPGFKEGVLAVAQSRLVAGGSVTLKIVPGRKMTIKNGQGRGADRYVVRLGLRPRIVVHGSAPDGRRVWVQKSFVPAKGKYEGAWFLNTLTRSLDAKGRGTGPIQWKKSSISTMLGQVQMHDKQIQPR